MRGTRFSPTARILAQGIIPAHAGNTLAYCSRSCCNRDHPRACGEHTIPIMPAGTAPGSSPRMRGTLPGVGHLRPQPGIIPAHAGNTDGAVHRNTRSRDHPRACGEHIQRAPMDWTNRGSSPRMRGTPMRTRSRILSLWIIPAHAGNTQTSEFSSSTYRDHPRACGEHAQHTARIR